MNRRTFIQATGISLLSPTLFAKEKYSQEEKMAMIEQFEKQHHEFIEKEGVKRWMKFTKHMPKEGQQILVYHFNEYVGREGFHAGTVRSIEYVDDDLTVHMELDFTCGFWDEDYHGNKWSSGFYFSEIGKFALESRIWLQPSTIHESAYQLKEMMKQGITFDEEESVWIPITQQYLDRIPMIPRGKNIRQFSGK
jgi:hypothetical protein